MRRTSGVGLNGQFCGVWTFLDLQKCEFLGSNSGKIKAHKTYFHAYMFNQRSTWKMKRMESCCLYPFASWPLPTLPAATKLV